VTGFFLLRNFPNLTETGLLGAGLIGQAFGVIDQGLGLLLGKGHDGRVSLRRPERLARTISRGGVRQPVRESLQRLAEGCDRAEGRDGFGRHRGPATGAGGLWLHFESVANQARFILARDAGRRDEIARIARSEARIARALYDLTLDDSRIGFESSNQYYYMPLDLVEKVVNCESIAAGLAGRSTKP
jgi:hypothetical protein